MNRQEHLLTILAEEAVEVAHRVTKVLRFGIGDVAPGQFRTNVEELNHEITHLFTVVGLLREEGVQIGDHDRNVVNAKLAAIEKWLDHSYMRGTLQIHGGDE